eukprot:4511961-Alexandrium_andersonii.AAC.1
MISTPLQPPTIELREAAGRARKKRELALPQARIPRKSASPRFCPWPCASAAPPVPSSVFSGWGHFALLERSARSPCSWIVGLCVGFEVVAN